MIRITGGLPYLLIVRPKYHYENRKKQGRRIRGKAIVVGNHRAIFDVGVMMFTFPFRTLRPVAAEILYQKNPLMTFFLHLLGAVRVERDAFDTAFLGKCERILARGGAVEIYPESRLPKKGEETPLPFKVGAVRLALAADAPIIPVCQVGRQLFGGRLHVMIGEPVYASELWREELSEKENIRYINDYVREKIVGFQRQLEEEQKEK